MKTTPEEEKYVLTVAEGISTLNILHGEYEHPEKHEAQVKFSGIITAPGLYVEHLRTNNLLDSTIAIVFVKMDADEITYNGNPKLDNSDVVTGKLQLDERTKEIGLNTSKRYNVESLKSFIKMNRLLFTSPDANDKMLQALAMFKLKYNQEIEQSNDNRGNKKDNKTSVLDTDIPFDFSLRVPIFKNQEPTTVKVDVLLEVRDGGVSFWLESIEYKEAIDTQRKEIFDKEIKNFDGMNVIYL